MRGELTGYWQDVRRLRVAHGSICSLLCQLTKASSQRLITACQQYHPLPDPFKRL